MFLSNRKLRYIIITLLLLIFCFFLGIFKPKAEMLNVELTSANWYVDNNNNGWKTNSPYLLQKAGWTGFKVYDFNNINFYATANVRLFMTNGSLLANKSASFSVYLDGDFLDLVGITLLDNNSAYTCEVYSAINNESTNVYNIVCPNLPASVNSNSFSINTYINWNGGGETYVHSFKLGVSGINAWSNDNNTLNNINNNTQTIVNDINNSNIDSSGANSSATEWNGKNATNGTITQLLTLPITLLQAIVNGLQTSCSSFSLGSLFNTNISLPCINVGNLIGSGLWTTIDILFSGFMILAISKKLIKIFNDFTNLKSNQIDELYGGGNK